MNQQVTDDEMSHVSSVRAAAAGGVRAQAEWRRRQIESRRMLFAPARERPTARLGHKKNQEKCLNTLEKG